MILGAGGQLGRALLSALPDAIGLTREHCDLTCPEAIATLDLSNIGAIINAAAYTAVDDAETAKGRRTAWATNVAGVAGLTVRARERGIPLVQVSSDYVFDGEQPEHPEDEPFSPLGVYGQTKAAGDAIAATHEQHYIVRTSWVVGQGDNFVATMMRLAATGASPRVVDDQYGRLTFADDLAAGIVHLLRERPAYGTYNFTNTGPTQSRAAIAAEIFELQGRDRGDIQPVTTRDYAEGATLAARPTHSTLPTAKLEATGFTPAPVAKRLRDYTAAMW